MNVFQNFNNLWHNNNFFYNLFKNVWNFDNFLNGCGYWDNLIFISVNSFVLSIDLIDNVSFSNKSLLFNNSVIVYNNLFNLSVSMFNCNNFLFNAFNLLNFLVNQWNFDWSISIDFNKFVNFN